MKMLFLSIILALLPWADGTPRDAKDVVSFDKTVHDFGDVTTADGPLSCTFTLTNIGPEPIAIFEVVSSCGCTGVKWTKEPLQPGKSGTIEATYKNEDGATPFDKTLTVYISGVKKPVILRIRGVVHAKKKSLSELFGAERLGDFGIKSRSIKTATLKQGLSVSETVTVANLGKKALKVSFKDVSPELSVSIEPNPIPAGSKATLSVTVKSNPEKYGRNYYKATPVVNGVPAGGQLEVMSWTQENFAGLSAQERENGPLPYFATSTFNMGTVPAGKTIEIEFPCTNKGRSTLHFYKADTDIPQLKATSLPELGAQGKGTVRFTLDTSALSKGEQVLMITLTTNSPLRPMVNLFVAGEVK